MSGLTRDEAREQVAEAIHRRQCGDRCEWTGAVDPWEPDRLRLADAALSVLWPEVERLTRERDDHYDDAREQRMRAINAETEVERLTAELAHAHAVIARHVEPRRGPDCTPGALPADETCPPRVPGRGGGEHG